MASSETSSTASGAISLLDLPTQSAIGIDGHVILLKRDDFVGIISGVPSDHMFHLLTVRPASTTQKETFSTLTCGFVLFPPKKSDWIVARRYDPRTEEVDSTPLDELTTANLNRQVQEGQMQQRVVPYDGILPTLEIETWKTQTSFISEGLLDKRGLCHGDKVVPGCYEDDNCNESNSEAAADGKSLVCPPIPVLDDTSKLKRTSHIGTKRYLAELSPADRTALFMEENPADRAFANVLARYYGNNWKDLLGDIQLSYTMFLHIQCLASMEHWRDLVAMTSTVDSSTMSQHAELYTNLLKVLVSQVKTMEQDFFEDIEYSGDNFFIPAIERLSSRCSQVAGGNMADSVASLSRILSTRLPGGDDTSSDRRQEGDELDESSNQQMGTSGLHDVDHDVVMDGESDNDSDGPVVVGNEEIEAANARSSQRRTFPSTPIEYSKDERQAYPLLFAAKLEHEDILMVCSRILDEKNDVSLVREAAAYLEEVEAKRKCVT